MFNPDTLATIKRYVLIAIFAVLTVVVGHLWVTRQAPLTGSGNVKPLPTVIHTQVTNEPRLSATDSNVEVSQVYRAKINGEEVTVPITTLPAPNGTKGVIKQEFDFSPIMNRIVAAEIKSKEKAWSVSAGVGIHKGDVYIPLGVEKATGKSSSVSAEVHIGASGVSGGQVKAHFRF